MDTKKLFGLGMVNLISVWLMCCLLTVMAKVIFTKYPVSGVSEFIQTV